MDQKIRKLIESSRRVILDCCIENGAIVAANTDKEYYPIGVQNYRFVWPRDVSFSLYAAHILGIADVQKRFISWLLTRTEGFAQSGIICQRYATHGTKDRFFGHQYQPDQAGSLLWMLIATNPELDQEAERAVRLLAEGLCSRWKGTLFDVPTYDLWEERATFPELEDCHIYSLAACSAGLSMAGERHGEKRWIRASTEMRAVIAMCDTGHYPRLWGRLPDRRVDASVCALVWPFAIRDDDPRAGASIALVGERLLTDLGVMRYEHDEYCGRIDDRTNWKKGAGGWPLLTFWYCIALARMGRMHEARGLFEKYAARFEEHIPEQVFGNDIQKSICPLCWSHSMFVIACKELGYLD